MYTMNSISVIIFIINVMQGINMVIFVKCQCGQEGTTLRQIHSGSGGMFKVAVLYCCVLSQWQDKEPQGC